MQFSLKVNSKHSQDIKDIMALAKGTNLISFAGGMPNNKLFPVEEIDILYNALDRKTKAIGFQYGPTSGYPPFVGTLKRYLKKKGLPVDTHKLLITTGSLQAISIITQEFVNAGDNILLENPSFVGAISIFETYEVNMHNIPIDKNGIIIEKLIEKIEDLHNKPKFLYVTPNYHNPAGIIYSLERKKALLKVLEKYDILLIEDDAYSDLYFNEDEKYLTETMVSMKSGAEVVYTGSFSKILGPGFRLGWLLATPEIFEKSENIKQALDACTSNFTQILANEFVKSGELDKYLVFLRKEYKKRKDILQENLLKYMPKEVVWNEPKGGFYVWLKIPKHIKATEILKITAKQNVMFIPGRVFDPLSKKDDRIRLAYSNVEIEDIEKGVRVIADALKEYI